MKYYRYTQDENGLRVLAEYSTADPSYERIGVDPANGSALPLSALVLLPLIVGLLIRILTSATS